MGVTQVPAACCSNMELYYTAISHCIIRDCRTTKIEAFLSDCGIQIEIILPFFGWRSRRAFFIPLASQCNVQASKGECQIEPRWKEERIFGLQNLTNQQVCY